MTVRTLSPSTAPDASRDVAFFRALVDRIEQDDPGAFNNLGVLYFSRGMLVEALDMFLRALAIEESSATAAKNLEITAQTPGACDVHLAVLDARIASTPSDNAARRQRARLLRLIGRIPEATRALDRLLGDDPQDASALMERALLEQKYGDLHAAQRWFERAIASAPALSRARLGLAEVHYHRGQNEQALGTLDALLTFEPDLADAHMLRGFVLGDMGHAQAGLDAAAHAASLKPSLRVPQRLLSLDGLLDPGSLADMAASAEAALGIGHAPSLARYGLGLAFRQRGYFPEAKRELERARENGEDPQLVEHALAELALIDGDSAGARARYEWLRSEYELSARQWTELGVAHHQTGVLAIAGDCYRRALRLDSQHACAHNNLGVLLHHTGDVRAAREALQRAIAADPALMKARLNLSRWYAFQGDDRAAMSELRDLESIDPPVADVYAELGSVLYAQARHAEARDALLRAIELRPTHGAARYLLADVFAVLGESDAASREIQHAMSIAPIRQPRRLELTIQLQRECPDAVGAIDLLALRATAPLDGVTVDAQLVADLLPESDLEPHSDLTWASQHDRELSVICHAADAFAARGLHGEALDRYEQVRRGTADRSSARYWQAAIGEARSRCLLGDGASCIPLLKELGTARPRDPEVLALYARATADGARTLVCDASIPRAAMRRLLQVECSSGALMHFAGDAAVRLGDDELATALYRRALAMDPGRVSVRVSIAALHRRRGELMPAELELTAALSAHADWRDATLELARVHADGRHLRRAIAVLAKHLERAPTDVDATLLLAEYLIAIDERDHARVAVNRVLRHAPDESGAVWLDGVLLARQGRMRDARACWVRLATAGAPDGYTERAIASLASGSPAYGAGDASPYESEHVS